MEPSVAKTYHTICRIIQILLKERLKIQSAQSCEELIETHNMSEAEEGDPHLQDLLEEFPMIVAGDIE